MKFFKQLLVLSVSISVYAQLSQGDTAEKLIFIGQYDTNDDFAVGQRERILLDETNFYFFDTNKNFSISEQEFTYLHQSLSISKIHQEFNSQIKQSVIRFDSLDENNDQRITFEEFSLSSDRIFKSFDIDNNGIVDIKDKNTIAKNGDKGSKKSIADDRNDESIARIRRQISSAKYMLRMPSTHNLKGFLTQYDLSKTGSVSQVDFSQQRRNIFEAIDVNKDQWLSDEEYVGEYEERLRSRIAALIEDNQAIITSQFSGYDNDSDNNISLKEFHDHQNATFSRLDTNKDGFVSLDDETKALTKN